MSTSVLFLVQSLLFPIPFSRRIISTIIDIAVVFEDRPVPWAWVQGETKDFSLMLFVPRNVSSSFSSQLLSTIKSTGKEEGAGEERKE